MTTHLRKNVYRTLAILFSALALLWTAGQVQAEGETIRVISSSVTSEFPEGVRFRLEASSDSEITSIAVRFRAGQQTYGSVQLPGVRRGRAGGLAAALAYQ